MANSELHSHHPKAAMAGIENTLLKDEGIRVHIVQALQKLAPPDGNLQTIDSGTSSDVFLHLQRINKLFIIDAAEEGSDPSTIYLFDSEGLTQAPVCLNSVDQLGLPQSLKIMDYYGTKPKEIIGHGGEPKEIDWGLEPLHELKQKILEIANLMLEEVKAR